MFGQLIAYLRGLARRHKISAELEDEMRFHVERQIEANVRRGMSPAEAGRMARLEFGGITQTREAVRDVRTLWLDSLWRDLQLAVRLLAKQPAFTLTVSATLAVCLGANAALFAVVDHVLLRPLPIPAADRIIITANLYPKRESTPDTARARPTTSIACARRRSSRSRPSSRSRTGAWTKTVCRPAYR